MTHYDSDNILENFIGEPTPESEHEILQMLNTVNTVWDEGIIDTHCHIHSNATQAEIDEQVRKCTASGVVGYGIVGTHLEDWLLAVMAKVRRPQFGLILGLHPNYAAEYDSKTMAFLRKLVASPGVLAIGEIGLDYFRDYAPTLLQREAFLEQLDMADALLKPAVFHVRDAYDDFLRILERRKRYCRYLIHCFAGNREDYQRAHAIDCYFGIGGTITYKKNDELREIVAEIPRDRVLLETDSPYLSPEPVRGKPNSPANLTYVVKEISKIWGVSEQTVVSVTTHNAGTFFGVPTVSNGALTTE